MRLTIPILQLVFVSILHGQNLIPNPSFEEYTDCPARKSEIHLAAPWKSFGGDADFFHECSEALHHIKVPNCGTFIDGYQYARTGKGIAHIAVYNSLNVAGRELLGVELKNTMERGVDYYIRFFVSPDFSEAHNFGYTDAVALGFVPKDEYIDIPHDPEYRIPIDPAIENLGTTIRDTMGWTEIDGCYTADGSERYAIIGNFRPNSEVILEKTSTIIGTSSFMYIDDVSIHKYDPVPDTLLLCEGESMELGQEFLEARYEWSTGATSSKITVEEAGTYVVSASIGSCTLRDTVLVLKLDREEDHFKRDTSICSNESLELYTTIPGEVSWTTGSESRQITVDQEGAYSATIQNRCGSYTETVDVAYKDCDCIIEVPTVFSPDGNGINDELRGYVYCDFSYRIKAFYIFDRWGNKVLSSFMPNDIRWDGVYNGKISDTGIYTWIGFLEYENGGRLLTKELSGNITVLK